MQQNHYSNGSTQAVLSREQIRASWGRGDHSGSRIQLINEAFRLFYRYRNRIERVSGRGWDTYWAMLRELEDAGDTGWGPGVQDLDDAFRHLIAQNGCWTDENTRAYWGLNLPSVYRVQVFDGPAAAANFLTALNDKLRRFQELAAEYRRAAQSAEDPEVKLRKLRDLAHRMNALAWLLPAPAATGGEEPPSLYDNLIEGCELLNKAVEGLEALGVELRRSLRTIVTVTDWLTRADQAAQVMLSAQRAGMPPASRQSGPGLPLPLVSCRSWATFTGGSSPVRPDW